MDAIISVLGDRNPLNGPVPHYRLLTKLENYGVTEPMLSILKDFSTGQSMRTVVEGSFSDSCDILLGVPQGSLLLRTKHTCRQWFWNCYQFYI